MIRSAALLLFVFAAALPTARAAELPSPALPARLSLEEALTIFRAQGLDLLIAEAAVTSAEGDLRSAQQIANPNLSYTFSHIFNYDPEIVCPPATPGGFGGSAACSPNVHSVTLTDGAVIADLFIGKRRLRITVAESALKAARMSREDARRALEFQLKSQYMQAVLASGQLHFAIEVLQGWKQTYDLVHLRYQNGAISLADDAKVETALLEADRAVSSARQALLVAKASLALLLGVRDALPQFEVAQDLPKYSSPARLSSATPESLLKDALETRPDVKALTAQYERARASVQQAERSRFPDLTLQAGFNYAAQAGGTFSSNTVPPTLVVGISGNLPVFYQQQGEIVKAEADVRTQATSLAKARAQVVSDVASAHAGYSANKERVERMEGRLLDRARLARDLTKVQYDKGAASLLEYLDAQRTFIATNVEYLQDLANYWIAVFQLEQAIGAELK
jgi:cobalt-zinc-cadmium efflux system outer membrane protein